MYAVPVAALCREILSAAPGALGVKTSRKQFPYHERADAISKRWPKDVRSQTPTDEVVEQFRAFLDEHDQASERARSGPRGLLAQQDPLGMAFVPDPSVARWAGLSQRASIEVHRFANVDLELRDMEYLRRLVNELTTLLFGLLAPFFVGIRELDLSLGLTSPTVGDAEHVAALLPLSSHYSYFFDRAGARWLVPLGSAGLLDKAPKLIQVETGSVAPNWPQGRYLARIATENAQRVTYWTGRVAATDNPRVARGLVDIARNLPTKNAALLVRRIVLAMKASSAEFYAQDAVMLVLGLADSPQSSSARTLELALIDAVMRMPRERSYLLESVLGEPIAALEGARQDMVAPLRERLARATAELGPSRKYSTLWLQFIDRPPQYGQDHIWWLANATYRALVAAPIEPGRKQVASILKRRHIVLARVALQAVASRPELIEHSDSILTACETWDGSGTVPA